MQAISGIVNSQTTGIFQAIELNQKAKQESARAKAEVKEINRLREEEARRGQSTRADRVRTADEQAARVIVAMADMGGLGTGNEARFLGEVGGFEGLDLARITRAFSERDAALESQGKKVKRELRLFGKALKMAAIGNSIQTNQGIADSAASGVDSAFSGGMMGGGNQGNNIQNSSVSGPGRNRPQNSPPRFVGSGQSGV